MQNKFPILFLILQEYFSRNKNESRLGLCCGYIRETARKWTKKIKHGVLENNTWMKELADAELKHFF